MTDCVLTRRAVRKFTKESIPDAEVGQLIAAFNAAPCGMHRMEDMRGVVVKDKNLREKVEASSDHACYDAPLLFIITTKTSSNFGERDASVAAENIMVEANSLNIGSVYVMGGALKVDQDKTLRHELEIDDDQTVQVIVSLGYPAEKPEAEDRSHRYQVTIK